MDLGIDVGLHEFFESLKCGLVGDSVNQNKFLVPRPKEKAELLCGSNFDSVIYEAIGELFMLY